MPPWLIRRAHSCAKDASRISLIITMNIPYVRQTTPLSKEQRFSKNHCICDQLTKVWLPEQFQGIGGRGLVIEQLKPANCQS